MPTTTETLPIATGDDIVRVRQKVRLRAVEKVKRNVKNHADEPVAETRD